MHKNLPTKQFFPSLTPPNIVAVAVNPIQMIIDDDDDICPVCDGECICHNNSNSITPPSGSLSMTQLGALHTAYPSSLSTTSNIPQTPPVLPSLKIKLTVPQSILSKRRALLASASSSSINPPLTTSTTENSLETFPPPPYIPQPSTSSRLSPLIPRPKRRGRPPKAIIITRQASHTVSDVHAASTFHPNPSHPPSKRLLTNQKKKSSARLPAPLKGRPLGRKSVATPKPRRTISSESSDVGDLGNLYRFRDDGDDDDAQSGQFPTFVSASVLSSRASSSSADDSSDLSALDDIDSSIEAEEEIFIRSEMSDRARVRRQLLGEDGFKKMDPQNAWVIRPRKRSEGPSDIEMDIDTDATEDDDQEEEEEEDLEEDGEEPDGQPVGTGYIGLATGWSEEDEQESSFDADLFFANLSSSEPDHDGSSPSSSDDGLGDDGDQSDIDSSMEVSITSLTVPPKAHHDKVAFEVTESWDGQITFTNGLSEGQGILDMDFEAHAAQYTKISPSPSQESDMEMLSDVDDGGYEEDTGEGEGDTTDEELVGEDDLPNERAMRLFNLPFSVSAINPMSTMSPAVSPGPRDRKPFFRSISSPKPADILSGKVFWDSDGHDEFVDPSARRQSLSSMSGCTGPRAGHFEVGKDTRQAIIDDSHQDVPSPHPRFHRRKQLLDHYNSEDLLTPLQSPISQSLPPTTEETSTAPPEMAAADIVDLNELLEASFLAPDPYDSPNALTDKESRKPAKNFDRWDMISVGAFRPSRESGCTTDTGTAGWGSDTPASKTNTNYRSMMKSGPLSTMLWQNKGDKPKNRSLKMRLVISPVILPVRDRDGDPTTTIAPPPLQRQYTPPPLRQNHNYKHNKSRKESRREEWKLKRKSFGPSHPHQYHQHHSHHHHPNSKSRSTSSTQRNNFFMSSVPPLNL